jgi:hypothetical protein
LTFEESYEWDLNFVREEQKGVARKVYKEYSENHPEALKIFNAMARREGIWGVVALTGNMTGFTIPSFGTWGVDLTDPDTDWGAQARVDIPMMITYPKVHKPDKAIFQFYNPSGASVYQSALNRDGTMRSIVLRLEGFNSAHEDVMNNTVTK